MHHRDAPQQQLSGNNKAEQGETTNNHIVKTENVEETDNHFKIPAHDEAETMVRQSRVTDQYGLVYFSLIKI